MRDNDYLSPRVASIMTQFDLDREACRQRYRPDPRDEQIAELQGRIDRLERITVTQVRDLRRRITVAGVTNRAAASFEVRSLDSTGDERVFEGAATTVAIDRLGDQVLPGGARYTLPVPLCWQHKKDAAIGLVTSAEVRADHILVRATIPRIAEPGDLQNLCDKAWQSVKAGLVRGLSIGFLPLETEPMRGGGQRITKWDWLELSLVTIPANAGAAILRFG
jgi:Escherichia/Staphylococcus phage prohead protease